MYRIGPVFRFSALNTAPWVLERGEGLSQGAIMREDFSFSTFSSCSLPIRT
jgi:hypothetical protein